MNKIYLIFLCLFHFSCKYKTKLENRFNEKIYFSDSVAKRLEIGYRENLIYNQWYAEFISKNSIYSSDSSFSSQLLYACNEEFVNIYSIDSNLKWIRLSVMACFNLPYCISVRQKGTYSELIITFTDGDGCFNSGNLKMKYQLNVTEQLFDQLYNELETLNYKSIIETSSSCKDGSYLQLEVLINGEYTRKVIRSCSIDKDYSAYFRCLEKLKKQIQFDEYLGFIKQLETKNEIQLKTQKSPAANKVLPKAGLY